MVGPVTEDKELRRTDSVASRKLVENGTSLGQGELMLAPPLGRKHIPVVGMSFDTNSLAGIFFLKQLRNRIEYAQGVLMKCC